MENGGEGAKKGPSPRLQLERRLEKELWYVDMERSGGWRWKEGAEFEPQWVTDMKRRFEKRGIRL